MNDPFKRLANHKVISGQVWSSAGKGYGRCGALPGDTSQPYYSDSWHTFQREYWMNDLILVFIYIVDAFLMLLSLALVWNPMLSPRRDRPKYYVQWTWSASQRGYSVCSSPLLLNEQAAVSMRLSVFTVLCFLATYSFGAKIEVNFVMTTPFLYQLQKKTMHV